MNNTLFYDKFRFYEITRKKYHHSNNHGGSPEHYVAYMLEGHCKIVGEHSSIEAHAGDVFYIPRGLSYQSYWYGNSSGAIRFLSYGFQCFPESEHTPFCLQTVPCSVEIKEQLQRIPTGSPSDSAALSAFFALLTALVPLMRTDTPDRDDLLFRKAKLYLYDHPDSTVREVARYCGISESTLYAVFKHTAGKTPNVVKQELLCERAVFLLTTTDKSVQEISDDLGVSSTSYFRKLLRAHTGHTPRDIRKSAQSV